MPIDYFPANKIIIDVDERLDGPLVIAYCRQDPHFKETLKPCRVERARRGQWNNDH